MIGELIMISRILVEEILSLALSTGDDFAEIFVEDTFQTTLNMEDGIISEAKQGRDAGTGIRVYFGTQAIYAVTSDISQSGLLECAGSIALAIDSMKHNVTIKLYERINANIHPVKYMPCNIPYTRKVSFMRAASSAAYAFNPIVNQVQISIVDACQNILIANSNGLYTNDRRVRCRAIITAIATKGGEMQTGSTTSGALKGWEFIDGLNPDTLGRKCAKLAVEMVNADHCPWGVMPVIIGGGMGGTMFHEACGHSLEATAFALGNSEFSDMLGQQIASSIVTVIDDGTLPGEWGSSNIDDE